MSKNKKTRKFRRKIALTNHNLATKPNFNFQDSKMLVNKSNKKQNYF